MHSSSRRTFTAVLCAVVVLVTAARIVTSLTTPVAMEPDTKTYLEPGRHILEGEGFTSADRYHYLWDEGAFTGHASAETFRTPVYALIAAAAERAGAGRLLIALQQLAIFAIAVALGLFVRRRAGSTHVGLLAAAAYFFHPDAADLATGYSPETLFTLLLFAAAMALLFAARSSTRTAGLLVSAMAGFLLASAALTRPVALYFGAIAAAWLVFYAIRDRKTRTLIFVITFALPCGAWIYRNHAETGVTTFSSVEGENLYFWRAAGVIATHDRSLVYALTSLQADNDFLLRLRRTQRKLVASAPGVTRGASNYAQRSRIYASKGWSILLADPVRSGALTVSGLVRLHFDWLWQRALKAGWDEIPAKAVFYPLAEYLFALACVGVVAIRRRDAAFAALSVSIIGYFTAITAGPESVSRFVVPVLPFYAALTAAGLVEVVRLVSRGRNEESGGAAADPAGSAAD